MSNRRFCERLRLLFVPIAERYKSGRGVRPIAEEFCVNPKTVRAILKEQGIEIKKGWKNLLSKTFGRLTVQRKVGSDNSKKIIWECKCSCGNIVEVRGSDLLSGKQVSCGCYKDELSEKRLRKYEQSLAENGLHGHNWKGIGDLSGGYISIVRNSAMERKILYDISKEYMWDLFLKQNGKCALTGVPLEFGEDQTASLDRINSDLGYIEGNVQWVHKWINIMKSDFCQAEFIRWCRLVVDAAPKGILYKTRLYLAGSMEYAIDGKSWRKEAEMQLAPLGITCFNPYEKPFINSAKEDDETRANLKTLMENEDFEKVHSVMRSVRNEDLRICDISDFSLIHIDPKVPSWGTANELYQLNAQKKPIFVVIEGGRKLTPLWLMGVLPQKYFYDSLADAIDMIKKINNAERPIDSSRWRLLKHQYR